MVLVHGGGGTAHARRVRLWNSAALPQLPLIPVARAWRRMSPTKKRLDDGGPPVGRLIHAVDKPIEDQWAYHAVADIVLAHSLLRSLPEVDAEKIRVDRHLVGWLSDVSGGGC